jgi:hypothetical protein
MLTKTTDYVAQSDEGKFIIDGTSGNVQLTLRSPVNGDGTYVKARNIAGRTMTVIVSGGSNIDDAATFTFQYENQAHTFLSDGSQYYVY